MEVISASSVPNIVAKLESATKCSTSHAIKLRATSPKGQRGETLSPSLTLRALWCWLSVPASVHPTHQAIQFRNVLATGWKQVGPNQVLAIGVYVFVFEAVFKLVDRMFLALPECG